MFSDPANNLKQFSLGESMVVADLGAGSGFYAVEAGRIVKKGKVYAVEVLPDLIPTIRNKAHELHLSNVECLVGDVETKGGTKLGTASVDRVIASNILFQVESKEGFIEEVKRILKPGGQVLLVDWSESGLMGPREDNIVSEEQAKKMFEGAGFAFEKDIEAGEYHYGAIFTRP